MKTLPPASTAAPLRVRAMAACRGVVAVDLARRGTRTLFQCAAEAVENAHRRSERAGRRAFDALTKTMAQAANYTDAQDDYATVAVVNGCTTPHHMVFGDSKVLQGRRHVLRADRIVLRARTRQLPAQSDPE